MTDESPVQKQRRRADIAWQDNAAWERLTRDAYDFVIPQRRPGGSGKRPDLADRIFDMTGPTSAMNLAGELQNRLFSGPVALETGTLVHMAIGDAGKAKLDRELEKMGGLVHAFMQAGDLDTATHEMCIDLGVGTGALIPLRGTPDQPIIFYAPPADEIAVSGDAWGRQSLISWKRTVTREGVIDAFPQGKFPDNFREAARTKPNEDFELYQDFYRLPDGRWRFVAYLDRGGDEFIASETYLTKPISVAPYFRVPGEMRGRGPVLLALPSIKTLNKAQELALRAAAIQMLGIWGYRAGGTFNPDTVNVGAGEFWPMQSTGGILGPDVQRMDPATGRLDIGRMVIEGMQGQVREALFDTRLPPQTGTPRSASEIAATIRQNARVHLNGFQRLWRSIHPVIVPRCAEILHSFGYLPNLMSFNELMVAVSVRSPIVSQMKADQLVNIANYIEMMIGFAGPQRLDEFLKIDETADTLADTFTMPKNLIPLAEEREQIRQAKARAMQEQQLAEAAMNAAPQIVDAGLRAIDGGRSAGSRAAA